MFGGGRGERKRCKEGRERWGGGGRRSGDKTLMKQIASFGTRKGGRERTRLFPFDASCFNRGYERKLRWGKGEGKKKRRKRRREQEKYLSRLLGHHALEMKDKQDGAWATSSFARASTPSCLCELRLRQRACISCCFDEMSYWDVHLQRCEHFQINAFDAVTPANIWLIWEWRFYFFSFLYSCFIDVALWSSYGISFGYV